MTLCNKSGWIMIIRFHNHGGVVRVDQIPGFGIFLKSASRLVSDEWIGLKSSSCRCHFWTFQLELDILDTKDIDIGSVDTKLQLFEVGWFLENPTQSQALMRQNPRIFRFCVKLYISVHQNLDFFEKTRRFVLIVSPKLYRVRTSPWLYRMFG